VCRTPWMKRNTGIAQYACHRVMHPPVAELLCSCAAFTAAELLTPFMPKHTVTNNSQLAGSLSLGSCSQSAATARFFLLRSAA